jgi:holo-[acyl-carrier protein] synthase
MVGKERAPEVSDLSALSATLSAEFLIRPVMGNPAGVEQVVSCTLDSMIVGIGVDLCEVDRIEAAIARHGERFLVRIYTEAERAYCESKLNRMERFAGRFAAKEAAMKAIGTGWGRGVGWRDFEVMRAASGQPMICFHGVARTIAAELGVRRALVSITHIKSMAMAQVVLETE